MIYISAIGMLNALGNDSQQIAASLKKGEAPGMQLRHGWLSGDRACWLGRVEGELPAIPAVLSAHNTRNNQLLLAALIQIRPTLDAAIARYGASRVAIVLGTSTSGVDEGDQQICGGQPDYHYQMQELGDPSRFLAHYLQLDGPAYPISTACSSSARAIISGERLIAAGLADVALVGGADSLSRMPINGFDSLESLSERRCAQFSRERDGISIGEGAALMLLTREPQPLALLGAGESSDAWHMSAPHPQGEGAERAMQMALQQANLLPQQVGYINLHGTATPLDETLPDCGLLLQPQALQRPVIASNSFAFGGNNTCLILGRLDGH